MGSGGTDVTAGASVFDGTGGTLIRQNPTKIITATR